MRRKIITLILTGTMLAGISVNAMELERNMIAESTAEEVAVDESIKEEAVPEADLPEGTVFESREKETGNNEEFSNETAVSESLFEKIEREESFLENTHGESVLSLSERMEEGADIIADSDMDAVMIISEPASGKCGENAYWEFDGVDTLTISGDGEMENYGIIRAPWWEYKNEIVALRIDYGITTIGDFAFCDCNNLTDIIMSDSVTQIGDESFIDCSSVNSITLPKNVTRIGDRAFAKCKSLVNINIPDGVTCIDKMTFSGCSSLSNIIIPDSVTEILDAVFEDCSSLTNIVIPKGVTDIGRSVFYGCSSLTSITILDGIDYIGGFDGCSGLEEVIIPCSVNEICAGAFKGCNSLNRITGMDSVTKIGSGAFEGCSRLTDIKLPKILTEIGWGAFKNCSTLTQIIFEGDAPKFEETHKYGSGIFSGDSLIAYYPANNDTWTADVMQDYGGTVTWKPYTNLEDIGGNDNPENSLEAALSTITLSPGNESVYEKREDVPNGDLTMQLSTTGNLMILNDPKAFLIVSDNNFSYTFWGDGTAEIDKEGKYYKCSWETSGADIDVTNNSLTITLHEINSSAKISVEFNDFIAVNGYKINTYDDDSKIIFPWEFMMDVGVSFRFENYKNPDISPDLIGKIFSEAKTHELYKQNKGKNGVCYGMALAEASFAYGNFQDLNLSMSDFSSTAKRNWDLKKEDKNQKEDLTLDEYIQICHMAQWLPQLQVESDSNRSFGNKKRPDNIKMLVQAVKKLKNDEENVQPIIIGFTNAQGNGGHAVLPYDCIENEDACMVYVTDSNLPGRKEFFTFTKQNDEYTGEWEYSGNDYKSSDNSENYITFRFPFEPFKEAYKKSSEPEKTAYLLAVNMAKTMFPNRKDIVQIEDSESGEGGKNLTDNLYWILEETTIPFNITGTSDVHIAGDKVAVQYKGMKTGTVNVSMQKDNFSFATNQSGQKDAEVSYLFYNENDIKKVTIREPEQDSSLEVYNKDEKIYFKGLNSAEIKTETGDYDENGDFVPENTVVKKFTNLSEEEEYEVDGSQEIEHIVRVSDDTVIPEGSLDETEKPLQNIQLSDTEINLYEGESRILEVFYTPADTTDDKSVVWTSSDESVAVVDADGKISAMKAGNTVITALVGEKSALCHVTVTENKQPEETEKPVSTETPSQPTEEPVSTDTPRPSIPTSEPVQTSEPEKPGQTEIPVPTEKPEQPQPTEEPASTAAPEQPVPTAEPNPTQSPEPLQPTEEPISTTVPEQPIPTVTPSLTQSPEPPQSTEEPASTVAPEQPVPTAEPTSTQTPEQPYPTGTPVPVHTPEPQKPMQSIEFEQKNITLQSGETSKLNVIYTPADTTDSREVTWASSDEAVASVTTEGTVTAHKTGTTEITAKVGEKTAVCTVTVKTSGPESNADDENDNRNESSNSNTDEQTAGAQQENSALSSPKTGERDDWMIYVILAGSILAGITSISVLLRKKQEK